jgi:hypothetical protein
MAAGAAAFHRFVLDPVVAMCGGRAFVVPVCSSLAEGCCPPGFRRAG